MNYNPTPTTSSTFNTFSSTPNKYINATEDFFKSNSIVAKIAFVLIILMSFIILLRLGITTLSYFITRSSSPKLIDGMVDGKQLIIIPQDPNTAGSVTIARSVNASDGIEFTWSTWINIDNLTYKDGKYKCVFYKGNDYANNPDSNTPESQQGLNFPNNAPGLYIAPDTNNLVIIMNTFNVINEQIIVENIPLNKWFNVVLRCKDTTLDVYINGSIIKSHELHGVPKQNYGDVYVAPNGGFSGNISNLWYYNYALGTVEISELATNGPNVNHLGSINRLNGKIFDYLSLSWIFSGMNSSA